MAVTFGAVGPSASGATNNTGNALSWSHTCAAGATELLAGCTTDMNPDTGVTMSATYNGITMTSLGVVHVGGGTAGFLQVWRLPNPPTGSAFTLTVTPSNPGASSGLNGGSMSFAGSGSLSAIQTASGVSGSASLGFTGSGSGNLVAMFAGGGNPFTLTAGTSRFAVTGDNVGAAGDAAGATVAGSGGTVTCTWTLSSTDWAVLAVEVQAGIIAPPAPPVPRPMPPGWFPGADRAAAQPGGIPFYAQPQPADATPAVIIPPTPEPAPVPLPMPPGWFPGADKAAAKPGGIPFYAQPLPVIATPAVIFPVPEVAGIAEWLPLPPGYFPGSQSVTVDPGGIPFYSQPLPLNPPPAPPPVPVITGASADGTYFTDQDGNPRLFVCEDTWGLIANAGSWGVPNYRSVLDTFMQQRAAQGFTAVEVSAFSYPGANTTWGAGSNGNGSDWDGAFPFTSTTNPSSGFNNTFWARRDYLFSSAAARGITVVVSVSSSWLDGTPTPVFCDSWTSTQWADYGTGLANRYKNIPNIMWILGDDYFGGIDSNLAAWLAALRAAGDTHLVSIQNYQESTSRYDLSTATHDPLAFDVNAQYDWVYWYGPVYLGITAAITNTPGPSDVVQGRIPAVWGDGPYLNQGLAGMTPEHLLRNMIWWAMSSGACGWSVGDNAIWPWSSGAAALVTTTTFTNAWIPAITSVLTGLDGWWKLRPDSTSALVTAGRGTPATPLPSGGGSSYENDTDRYVSAALATDGSLAIIYCAGAFSITVNQAKLGAGYTATWVDPASGATSAATPGSTYDSTPKGNNSAGNADWVLVLQGPAVTGKAPDRARQILAGGAGPPGLATFT